MRRALNFAGSLLIVTIPLHVLLSQMGSCTEANTGYFLSAMVYAAASAVLGGLFLSAAPRYSQVQLIFLGLMPLTIPFLTATFLSATVSGRSLCGPEFDGRGVAHWERLFAPFFIILLAGLTRLIWKAMKKEPLG
ncbi:MAG: hypothetical protein Q7J64_03180 [Elusimicrobiota bacterium]|nr:hypothetical protein [Elusimicrobiota bacterium]